MWFGELALCLEQVQYFVLCFTVGKRHFTNYQSILEQPLVWQIDSVIDLHTYIIHNFTCLIGKIATHCLQNIQYHSSQTNEHTLAVWDACNTFASILKTTNIPVSDMIYLHKHVLVFSWFGLAWCGQTTWHEQGVRLDLVSLFKPAFCLICSWHYDQQICFSLSSVFSCLPFWFTVIKKKKYIYFTDRHISGIIVALHDSNVVSLVIDKASRCSLASPLTASGPPPSMPPPISVTVSLLCEDYYNYVLII